MRKNIPISEVYPNPDQPRKIFDEGQLRELAASIRQHGLIQPITVRPDGAGKFMIVAGERRYRAHVVAGMSAIKAIVEKNLSDDQLAEQAIVENLQRVDISPMEEAHAYQRMLDKGYSIETLAKRLGLQQTWRITERTALLSLREEFQHLFASNQITRSQATELARLSPGNQTRLFQLIKRGKCPTYTALRAAANGLLEAEQQGAMFEAPEPTEEESRALRSIEARIEAVRRAVAAGFQKGELVIARKIAPDRAGVIADELRLIQKHLADMEKALRQSAVQGELAA
jgi:ParB family transcriptional regulator, chromosome partitioning protein